MSSGKNSGISCPLACSKACAREPSPGTAHSSNLLVLPECAVKSTPKFNSKACMATHSGSFSVHHERGHAYVSGHAHASTCQAYACHEYGIRHGTAALTLCRTVQCEALFSDARFRLGTPPQLNMYTYGPGIVVRGVAWPLLLSPCNACGPRPGLAVDAHLRARDASGERARTSASMPHRDNRAGTALPASQDMP